ncbi:hypothetical protein N9242_02230 [Vicingaceae bacterium]|nr:hypothetical protein [Vicingaceae bacterium]
MKTRYKIVVFNVFLTLLYFVFILLYLSNSKIFEDGIVGFFSVVSKTIMLLLYYNLINTLWLGIVIFGLLKKNKELIMGGSFSLGLSLLMFLLLILYYQM